MMFRISAVAVLAGLFLSAGVSAQQPAPVDPVTLSAAREVVSAMQGDRAAVLQSMSAPMTGLLAQMGIREPERAQVLVGEVIVPTLAAHFDELLDVQARAFASTLTSGDLRAIAAFYASPAGRNLAAAQPRLTQAQVTGMTQWMGAIAPEIQGKLAQAVKKHGWDAPAKK